MSDRLDGQIDRLVYELKSLSRQMTVDEDLEELIVKKLHRIRLDFSRRVRSCIPKHLSVPAVRRSGDPDER
tara:strand:- start:461 stop:673 length:213 start_codon:yes stop_codon:yes gene_type:complete